MEYVINVISFFGFAFLYKSTINLNFDNTK